MSNLSASQLSAYMARSPVFSQALTDLLNDGADLARHWPEDGHEAAVVGRVVWNVRRLGGMIALVESVVQP